MVHKIDGPGASPTNTFLEDAPGVPGTVLTAKWANMAQDELLGLLAAAGIEPDDTASDQVSDALDILFGAAGAAALKNRLINGAVQLWQRGTAIAVANVETYTADRWAATADAPGAGVGAATLSRQAFTPGQAEVGGDPPFFLRWTQTVAATAGAPKLVQKLENVGSLAGGPATVSFFVRAGSNSQVSVRLVQTFGAGGSADVVLAAVTLAASTSWAKRVATFDVPSVAGKTTGPGSSLRVEFLLPSAETFQFDFVDLQAEPGQSATPFERRSFQLEYAFAARYFEKSYPLEVAPGTAQTEPENHAQRQITDEGYSIGWLHYPELATPFRVTKRARPTIAWYAVEGTGPFSGKVSRYQAPYPTWESNLAVSTVRGTSETSTGYPITVNPSNLPDFGPPVRACWTADAEL